MKYLDHHYYHIFNRGAHKAPIFFSRSNYIYCLDLVKKYRDKYKVTIEAYCLMPNHYHFVVYQEEGGSISKFIQTIFNAYSQAINLQQHHSGTLFQGKAKAQEVDSEDYSLRLIRYVHLNPVRAKLVGAPEKWEFSDYCAWVGVRNGMLTDLSLRDHFFKSSQDYREFVESYKEEADWKAPGSFEPSEGRKAGV